MSNEAAIWFPYHIKDFRSEMSTYSFEERGVYVTLIERLWECDGYLAGDDASVASELGIKPREWSRLKNRILRNFVIESGRLSHARLLVELAKAKANVEQKRRAGKASADARKGNGRSTGVATDVPTAAQREGNGKATAGQPCAGGGGGKGYSPQVHYQSEELGGETRAREPLTVLPGGRP